MTQQKVLAHLQSLHEAASHSRRHIEYKRSYCINDFKDDYYAYKGNAYGLANTLMQTDGEEYSFPCKPFVK